MILRRFSQHVKEQNWFAVFLDLLVVVTGIFLGLQVTEWNEQRKFENSLTVYYQRLIDDLNEDIAIMESSRDYFLVTKQFSENTLLAIQNDNQNKDSDFIIKMYQATQITTGAFARSTYDELLNNGTISRLPNVNVRKAIVNYHSTNSSISSIFDIDSNYRTGIRSYISAFVQNKIKDKCGDQRTYITSNISVTHLPKTCPVEFSNDEISQQLSNLSRYKSIEQDLNFHIAQIDYRLFDYNLVIMSAKNLLELLKQENKNSTS